MRKKLDINELKRRLIRLDRLLNRIFLRYRESSLNEEREIRELRIRDIPLHLLLNNGMVNLLQKRTEEARKIKRRLSKNLREMKEIKKEIVEMPLEHLLEHLEEKAEIRSLLSLVSLTHQIERDYEKVKYLLHLLVREESYKRGILNIKERIREEIKKGGKNGNG